MKIASLVDEKSNHRDGIAVIVSRDLKKCVVPDLGPHKSLSLWLQSWDELRPQLEALSTQLNEGKLPNAQDFNVHQALAPLPFAPGFYDGSAFLSHVERARKSRGDTMPESAKVTPLMYQGVSDHLLSWNSPIKLLNIEHGGDFEGEFFAITGDIPVGASPSEIEPQIRLIGLFNDTTLREIVKVEIQTKFGFLQSKPNSAFAPVVVTPDELEGAYRNGRLCLDVEVNLNGKRFGSPNGEEMHFSFAELIAHASRTRPLSAGNIVGTGTVSNQSLDVGFATITEKRAQEIIDGKQELTAWLQPGDHLTMDVKRDGQSVFGKLDQKVEL